MTRRRKPNMETAPDYVNIPCYTNRRRFVEEKKTEKKEEKKEESTKKEIKK